MSSKNSAIGLIEMLINDLMIKVDGTPRRFDNDFLIRQLYKIKNEIEDLPIADTKVCCTIDKSVYSDPHIPETERIEHIKKVCGENIGYEIMKNNFFIVREDKRTNRVIVEVKVLGGK